MSGLLYTDTAPADLRYEHEHTEKTARAARKEDLRALLCSYLVEGPVLPYVRGVVYGTYNEYE